jgi:hypothetical protein
MNVFSVEVMLWTTLYIHYIQIVVNMLWDTEKTTFVIQCYL